MNIDMQISCWLRTGILDCPQFTEWLHEVARRKHINQEELCIVEAISVGSWDNCKSPIYQASGQDRISRRCSIKNSHVCLMDSMTARNELMAIDKGQKQSALLYQSDQGANVVHVIANVDE